MSMNNLTVDGEFRYIVQWFKEWSELQRDDFVPILVKYITGSCINDDDDDVADVIEAATVPVNMNGLPNDLDFNGRPMSLFQCRIKLFNQWNQRWPSEFKEKLQQKISEIDGKVGEKIKCALNPNNSGNMINGYASKEQDQQNLDQVETDAANFVSEAEAVALTDPMAEVLNNETSVDDIETNEDGNIETPLHSNVQHAEDHEQVADGNVNNDKVCSNSTRHKQAFNEHGELVEQVVQLQCLQINEENEESEKDHEDVIAIIEQKQQQPLLPSVTVTVNPVVVTQTLTTNTEVPLVV